MSATGETCRSTRHSVDVAKSASSRRSEVARLLSERRLSMSGRYEADLPVSSNDCRNSDIKNVPCLLNSVIVATLVMRAGWMLPLVRLLLSGGRLHGIDRRPRSISFDRRPIHCDQAEDQQHSGEEC